VPYLLFVVGDNPMLAELFDSMPLVANRFCYSCEIDGSAARLLTAAGLLDYLEARSRLIRNRRLTSEQGTTPRTRSSIRATVDASVAAASERRTKLSQYEALWTKSGTKDVIADQANRAVMAKWAAALEDLDSDDEQMDYILAAAQRFRASSPHNPLLDLLCM
jgi:hypothetical protein